MDSLKQLALKFVFKEELEGFNFQRLFLSPFESVYVATQHKEIKVLVLDCIQNLVQARSAHIRSGWKSIFSVLAFAAKDGSDGPTFPRQAWEVVRRLVDEDMGSLVYDFLDVTKVRYIYTCIARSRIYSVRYTKYTQYTSINIYF